MENFDYRYYGQQGLPFLGTAPLFKSGEYESQTQLCRIAKQAFFDLRKPEDRVNGHTLEEVLSLNACGEYEIVAWREYKNNSKDPDSIPAVFIHVIWYEKFDVLISQYPTFIKNKFKDYDKDARPSESSSAKRADEPAYSRPNESNGLGESENADEYTVSFGGDRSDRNRSESSIEFKSKASSKKEAECFRSTSRVIWTRKRQKTKS
jgi:hypothetical protein